MNLFKGVYYHSLFLERVVIPVFDYKNFYTIGRIMNSPRPPIGTFGVYYTGYYTRGHITFDDHEVVRLECSCGRLRAPERGRGFYYSHFVAHITGFNNMMNTIGRIVTSTRPSFHRFGVTQITSHLFNHS